MRAVTYFGLSRFSFVCLQPYIIEYRVELSDDSSDLGRQMVCIHVVHDRGQSESRPSAEGESLEFVDYQHLRRIMSDVEAVGANWPGLILGC